MAFRCPSDVRHRGVKRVKTGKSITVVLTGLSLALALSFGALAHSSFIWETDWRPFHVLPFTFTLSVAA